MTLARKHFPHMVWKPLPHSFGVPVPVEWQDKADDDPVFGIFKKCGCWVDDEREILSACMAQCLGKLTLDIGCNVGLTSKTMNWSTNAQVDCIDPMLGNLEFARRFFDNTGFPHDWTYPSTSDAFFEELEPHIHYAGVAIDGDHEPESPLRDAQNAATHLEESGCILLHDTLGAPVQVAVTWLLDHDFRAAVYETVHVVTVAYRGNFTPPEFVPDPRVVEQNVLARLTDLDLSRVTINK